MVRLSLISSFLVLVHQTNGFFTASGTRGSAATKLYAEGSWYDYLKFDGATPTFDVLEKTKEYTATAGYRAFNLKDIPADYYAEDYIFRGPIVGPINRKDLVETNQLFQLNESYSDLDRQTFGFAVDPENPFRVMFFERWIGTNTGSTVIPNTGLKLPATGKKSISPVFPFSIVWNPKGEIVYETLTTAVDRFEGNTKGKVAVFGLLETSGISLDNNVGDQALIFQQKLNRFLNGGAQVYSKEEDIPDWWKSSARGAQKNDC